MLPSPGKNALQPGLLCRDPVPMWQLDVMEAALGPGGKKQAAALAFFSSAALKVSAVIFLICKPVGAFAALSFTWPMEVRGL